MCDGNDPNHEHDVQPHAGEALWYPGDATHPYPMHTDPMHTDPMHADATHLTNHHEIHNHTHAHETNKVHEVIGQHEHEHGEATGSAVDPTIPLDALRPLDVTRRLFLQGIGLIGATTTTSALVLGIGQAAAQDTPKNAAGNSNTGSYSWLSGDHHIHTQYSSDGQYTVAQHVGQAERFGLDWMVITDHGAVAHEKISVARTNSDVLRARSTFPNMLVFQGLEWNIPGAEHGTVFFPPTNQEIFLLQLFESSFDGAIINPANPKENSPLMESKAIDGIRWMAEQVRAGRVPAALFLANHPSRRGVDSPHEIRNWNDAGPNIAVGMEGAPGHQASSFAKSVGGPEAGRGFYDNTASIDSFLGYPPESYRTFGGFDWMTATVGGLWDSLLGEGRRWWITANSDSHSIYRNSFRRGAGEGRYADATSAYYGAYGDPVDTGAAINGNGDFWPGYYSRTVVGSTSRSYVDVMNAISSGRMWVMHGDLIAGLDVRVSSGSESAGVTLGGNYVAKRGDDVTINIVITPTTKPNNNGELPVMKRLDVIAGEINGRTVDKDTFRNESTKVLKSFELEKSDKPVTISYTFRDVRKPFYVRLRGTDGRFSAAGSIEPRLDPVPVDPWTDLWMYANPVFVYVR
jgi:PHP domain